MYIYSLSISLSLSLSLFSGRGGGAPPPSDAPQGDWHASFSGAGISGGRCIHQTLPRQDASVLPHVGHLPLGGLADMTPRRKEKR